MASKRSKKKSKYFKELEDATSESLDLSMMTEPLSVDDLALLPQARELDLSYNKLTALPEGFCGLTHLTRLSLNNNALMQLPEDFGNLSALRYLDLSDNKLTVLPLSIVELNKLDHLNLTNNKWDVNQLPRDVVGSMLDDSSPAEYRLCAKRVRKRLEEIIAKREQNAQKRKKKAMKEAAKREAIEAEEQAKADAIAKEEKVAAKAKKREEYERRQAALKEAKEKDDEMREFLDETLGERQSNDMVGMVLGFLLFAGALLLGHKMGHIDLAYWGSLLLDWLNIFAGDASML